MKKYIIYIIILVIGILLGSFIFNNQNNDSSHKHNSTTEVNQMWTCSMHPQIMQPESGDCPICGMDLIPAEANADGLAPDQFKITKNAIALADIQTSIVGNNEVENNTIKLSGKILENEEQNVVQVSYFSGRIERLNINFTGEKVHKGQLLATIYSPELFAAQQELLTTLALKESQPALYKAVRNKLKLWKLTEKQINQIEKSGKAKANFPIYATVSGTVNEKLVSQGESVKQGQPLLKISNLSTVWANFDVYENQISLFKKGQNISITTNAYPNQKFEATVSFIDPILNTKTRTTSLRAVLNNKKNIFKPGMFVEGKIENIKSNKTQTISIPSSAILWTGKKSVVYLKPNSDKPIFEMREVKLGTSLGNYYEVLEGLKIGDTIVTNGTFTVDAAAQLQGKKSMMNKNGGKTMTGHEEHMGMQTHDSKIIERIRVSSKFQEQLNKTFNQYINLKDTLLTNNSKEIITQAKKLLISLDEVDMKLLKKDSHNKWMKLHKEITSSINSIIETSDIKEQKIYFNQLTASFRAAIQIFGINKKVYHQFCPMADNNKGAYWLSNDEKIVNPYFGGGMLGCGSIKETLE
ncbi:efflux RND transporter periplasmic adaptor subunit [Tenacibaculum aiptasiae]|uniref:efflux RND transporter periplasmic adaptor subunit n=1 Tax=Tenacibaculum aiptasiae TaxID=426481 RepID=UPI00232BBBF9|nr:efflux RND transporter periplasmic adaptor subunit [Tenacibaculum aiptasiae]